MKLDIFTLLAAICAFFSALAVFPIYEKVLRKLKLVRERDDRFLYYLVGSLWLLAFCGVFVVLPMALIRPFSYAIAYLNVFGIVVIVRSFRFRRRMIAEGLDPRTENKKYQI